MGIDNLFSGNALCAVDPDGRTALPGFVLGVLERRCCGKEILFGPHDADPCINGYDSGYQLMLHAEIERRRLREESEGIPAAAHHRRARRAFGAVERAGYDSRGRITLPPMVRRRSRIRDRALFIGTGGSFEIWDPEVAREAGDDEVRELAIFALLHNSDESEVET